MKKTLALLAPLLPLARRLAPAVALLAVALLLASLLRHPLLDTGSVAPDFSLPRAGSPSGAPWSLAATRGRVVLVDFWSTSCPPCRRAIEDLKALHRDRGGDLEIVGVAQGGETLDEIAAFARERAIPYPLVTDETGSVGAQYRVEALPTVYVLDRAGRIVAGHVGYWPADDLREAIDDALAR